MPYRQPSPFRFPELPTELQVQIMKDMDFKTTIRMRATNVKFCNMMTEIQLVKLPFEACTWYLEGLKLRRGTKTVLSPRLPNLYTSRRDIEKQLFEHKKHMKTKMGVRNRQVCIDDVHRKVCRKYLVGSLW